MFLIIVESPKKAKAIGEFLKDKKEYKVISSQGHIRTLVKKNNAINDKYEFTWDYTPQWKKIHNELLENAKKSTKIILASDPDREGEAIAWHIKEVLQEKKINPEFKRITFNAISKEAILKALNLETEIRTSLVNAYLARTALDYIFGFGISPVLWRKVPCCKSAGRVQSVALRMIVEKENEIINFVKTKYFTILAEFKNIPVFATLIELNNKKYENGKFETKLELNFNFKYKVIEIEKKEHQILSPAPLITSTLQQLAFTKLGYNTDYTMKLAQKLYEGFEINGKIQGLITYMRTDSINIVPEEIKNIRNAIIENFGKEYLSENIIEHKSKVKNAQEAHEAIRPVNINIIPNELNIEKDALALYSLIWKCTLASQAKNCINEIINAKIEAVDENNHGIFELKNTINIFEGFKKIFKEDDEEDNNSQIHLTLNQKLEEKELIIKEHETQPPKRFNEASLVKHCQKLGIGRPSTYARISSILFEREYIENYKKTIKPTNIGWVVISFLKNYFLNEIEYTFTSEMEDNLDEIANNNKKYLELVSDFHEKLKEKIKISSSVNLLEVSEKISNTYEKYFLKEEQICSKCGGKLMLKFSKIGSIKGCENYPNCKFFISFNNIMHDKEVKEEKKTELLGIVDLENIELKNGPFGPYVQNSSKKIPIPKEYHLKLNEINLEKALFLLSLPKEIGKFNENPVFLKIGRFGPYIEYNKKFFSIKDIFNINLEKAIEIINKKIN